MLRSTLPDPNDAGQLTFHLAPGQYTYTAQALQGSLLGGSVLSTINPIPITVSPNFPLSIPMIAAFATFDNYQTDIGLDTPNSFIYFGTPNRDRIVQYGGAANDLLSVDGGDGNDTLIVNNRFGGSPELPVLIQDTSGKVIYQFGSGGTTITVANVEHLTVNGPNGTPVFTWP